MKVAIEATICFYVDMAVFFRLRTVLLRSDAAATIHFTACFVWLLFEGGYYLRAAIIQGRRLFLWKAWRHQRWLDRVRMSEMVTVVRHCQ